MCTKYHFTNLQITYQMSVCEYLRGVHDWSGIHTLIVRRVIGY